MITLSSQDIYVVGVNMVEHSGLIGQIWGGTLTVEAEQGASPLAAVLGSLMDVPVVTLASDVEKTRPFAVMEETEVLPGASLGDVLAEELSIDIPYGALVLVQPKDFTKAQDLSGQKLGEIIGHIILEMAQGVHSVEGGSADLAQRALSGQMVSSVKLAGVTASRVQ